MTGTKIRMNMKNEHERLSFIKALIDQLGHQYLKKDKAKKNEYEKPTGQQQ
jgi:hypothetical protein